MRTLITLVAVVFVACTQVQAQPSPSPAPAPAPLRAELARLVDALAAMPRVESSHVGVAGAPSPAWAAWEAVKKAATATELAELVTHPSPIVRGYVTQHRVRTEQLSGALDGWLAPLLADRAALGTTDGCMLAETTIAELALEELCWNASDKDGARATLSRVAEDPRWSALAERAARCLPEAP